MSDPTDSAKQAPAIRRADRAAKPAGRSPTVPSPESLERALMSTPPAQPEPSEPPSGLSDSDIPSVISSADAVVAHTQTDKGHGAYAARAFKAGEVVEICPVIIFDDKFRDLPRCLQERVFDWGTLANTRRSNCLPLGYGAIYNHHDPANMTTSAIDTERLQALVYTAVRDIEPGEELTVNYNAHGGGHTWHDDNWFKQLRISRVETSSPLDEVEATSMQDEDDGEPC